MSIWRGSNGCRSMKYRSVFEKGFIIVMDIPFAPRIKGLRSVRRLSLAVLVLLLELTCHLHSELATSHACRSVKQILMRAALCCGTMHLKLSRNKLEYLSYHTVHFDRREPNGRRHNGQDCRDGRRNSHPNPNPDESFTPCSDISREYLRQEERIPVAPSNHRQSSSITQQEPNSNGRSFLLSRWLPASECLPKTPLVSAHTSKTQQTLSPTLKSPISSASPPEPSSASD